MHLYDNKCLQVFDLLVLYTKSPDNNPQSPPASVRCRCVRGALTPAGIFIACPHTGILIACPPADVSITHSGEITGSEGA
ncbi:MAG: hypothetical protein DDT22_01228 [candidate division WS2 bacterium]|nr:hypothetical protein [Candidatus Lithacetigena glycinireducens]